MHEPTHLDHTQRAPNGCSAQLRISCTPAERDRVIALARREQRSSSATARLLLQRGFESLENERARGAVSSLAS